MANPLLKLVEKHLGADFLPGLGRYCAGLKQQVTGLAGDFWKDGTENPLKNITAKKDEAFATGSSFQRMVNNAGGAVKSWHAKAGEVSEKMWGDGYVLPGGVRVTEWLITPMGLVKDMAVLDLSAGLGTTALALAGAKNVKVTALESDSEIAMRAQANGVASYNPDIFEASDTYNAIIAREIFYRCKDKAAFLVQLAASTKAEGQVSFTDYIVDPENQDKPAIKAWQAFEHIMPPQGVVATAELWARAGFNLRVHEDQTAFYRKEVLAGLKRFAMQLATGGKPDAATKKEILRQVQLWVHRMAAMEQGMKFYRFYGTKG